VRECTQQSPLQYGDLGSALLEERLELAEVALPLLFDLAQRVGERATNTEGGDASVACAYDQCETA
jgi:hypothetical protein